MCRKQQAIAGSLLLLISGASVGCSHRETIDRDEARSEIRSADSFVSESQMFIEYLREERSTRDYAEGHANYLQQAVKRASKHLAQAAPQPVAASAIHECRTQLDLLLVELSSIPSELGHPDRLSAASERMGRMRESLAGANSRL